MIAKAFRTLIALGTLGMLAACGGGGAGGGGSAGGGGGVGSAAGPAGTIVLTTGATEIVAGSPTQVTLRSTLRDAAGNPLSGVNVNFSTTLGTLTAASETTNAQGIAEVRLEAGNLAGVATVAAAGSGFVATTTVTILAGPPDSVSVTAHPATIGPGGVATINAVVRDANNNPVSGETVIFDVPTNPSFGTLAPISALTDLNGQVTVNYTAGSSTGTNTVRARAQSNSRNGSVNVNVSAAAPIITSLSISTGATQIVANGTSTVAVRASVRDHANQPVSGAAVSFTTSLGTLSPATGQTNASGFAEVQLTSTTTVGLATLTAAIAGHSAVDYVWFVPGPPASQQSSLTALRSSIPADGATTTTITATLADSNGNPLIDGTSVSLFTSAGTVISDNPTVTNLGRAVFTLRAGVQPTAVTLRLVQYPEITGTMTFGSTGSGVPSQISVSAISRTLLTVAGVGADESTSITVRVADESNLPVANTQYNNLRVRFLARPNGGEFLSGRDHTDALVQAGDDIRVATRNGDATINLQAGTLPGIVELLVEVIDASGNALTPDVRAAVGRISIASGPPHTIVLSAPTTDAVVDLNAGPDAGLPQTPGFYSRRAGLIVTDRYGNAVPDGTAINLGVLDSVLASSNAGRVTANGAQLVDDFANFTGAWVTRSGVQRFIQPNDRVAIVNAVAANKIRHVASAPTSATQLPVNKSYTSTANSLNYVVGAALLGFAIYGIDHDTGNATIGTARTKNGLASIRLVYPATAQTIHVGCQSDTRHEPWGSARVFILASSSDDSATLVSEGLCASSISGWKLAAAPTVFSGPISGSQNIELELRDGGDGVRLSGQTVTATVNFTRNTSGVTLNAPSCTTDINGRCTSTITQGGAAPASGDSATITYRAGDATVSVTYTVP